MLPLRSYLEKLRTWGAKGAWDYVVATLRNRILQRRLVASIDWKKASPVRGITIIAPLGGGNSLCKVMRDLAFNLKSLGIPFQTFNTSTEQTVPDEDLLPILTPRSQFSLLKYDHVIEMFSAPLPKHLPIKRSRIVFWEFESGLLEYDPKINDGHDVIAMSDFNRHVFKQLLPTTVAVHKILYPFHFENGQLPTINDIRNKYGIGASDFMVFFNFDLGSSYYRKNPEAVVKAFAQALGSEPDARLVFKVQGASQHADKLDAIRSLAAELSITDRFTVISSYLPQRDLYGLTNACDVYISLHRGEGFGLGIAEAMSLGKPVIITNYSGPTEFCTSGNSILIPYALTPVRPEQVDNLCYRFVKEWAEPDVNAAASALLRLYNDSALRVQLGNNGQKTIFTHFSAENFQASINKLLN